MESNSGDEGSRPNIRYDFRVAIGKIRDAVNLVDKFRAHGPQFDRRIGVLVEIAIVLTFESAVSKFTNFRSRRQQTHRGPPAMAGAKSR